ncbi:MAG TPA: DNA topology modulation protein [Pyrinomonadaceae bacterium]|nr:DNA topology modulation protein [Pyrinomonadaceae bacterium]
MKRVLVIGPGGSGKSTFARRLGQILDIEVKHLDRYYWRGGWTKPSEEDWLNTVNELIAGDSWILDGNYGGTLPLRVERCDTIIFLDMPRLLCVWRVTKRRLLYRKHSRPDMAEGCAEKLDREFISWVWNYSRRSRPRVLKLINENSERKKIVWLRSDADVNRFLMSCKSCQEKPQ